MDLADKFAIAELIQAWGVYRDLGKWQELRATFTPDGHISVSWFRGPFEHFVDRCRANFAAGNSWSRHHLFAPTIKQDQDRAVAETAVIIRVRQPYKGVPPMARRGFRSSTATWPFASRIPRGARWRR